MHEGGEWYRGDLGGGGVVVKGFGGEGAAVNAGGSGRGEEAGLECVNDRVRARVSDS